MNSVKKMEEIWCSQDDALLATALEDYEAKEILCSQDDVLLATALEEYEADSDRALVRLANLAEAQYTIAEIERQLNSTQIPPPPPLHVVNDVSVDVEINYSDLLDLESESRNHRRGIEIINEDSRNDIADHNISDESECITTNDEVEWSQNGQDYIDNFDVNLLSQNKSDDIGQYGGSRPEPQKVPLFKVINKSEHFYQKFQMQGTCYELEIGKPDPKIVPENWLRELLESVIIYFKSNSTVEVKSGDRIGMSLRNNVCGTEPVFISLRRADQMSAVVVFDHIMRIFDSNKDFFLNGHLTINFDHIQMPHGSGNPRVTRDFGQTNTDFIYKKACYLKYKNPRVLWPDDEYCLPYAIVLARAFIQSSTGENIKRGYQKYLRNIRTLRSAAVALCTSAGVEMSELKGGCSFDEVKKFQRVLPEYQIVIYGTTSKKPQYTDARYRGKNKMNIMLHDNHYTAMRSVQACFGAKYICPDCHTHTDNKTLHTCKYECSQCRSKPKCIPCPTSDMIQCNGCYRNFYGFTCYISHLKIQGRGKKSVCEAVKNCPTCKAALEKGHICGKRLCFTCEKIVDKDNHLCHMPKYETKRKPGERYLYVMYDLETQQDTLLNNTEPNKFKHVPNLCVSHSVCSKCIENSDISVQCGECGVREYIYKSKKCVSNLMDYLVKKYNETETVEVNLKSKQVPRFDKIIAIAHNMSGFDGQFILRYIYESDRFKNPKIIMNGTKIIEITLDSRIRFIDSLIYFQRGLADLPELFGFEGCKGYYPHLFNTPSNEGYKGTLPEKHFYGYDSLTVKGREKFDSWYESQSRIPGYEFDNDKELIEYCRQDVAILRKACIKFVTDFWEENHIDPFLDACTIAGACNKVFRSKYLEEETIGVIPTRGYRLADNQSAMALRWLALMEMEHNIEIQYAGRGLEYKIPGIGRVDGYHTSSRTVFEFDGCYWHSCVDCYPAYLSNNSTSSVEIQRRRDATIARHKAISAAGYRLIVMRECDFKREMEENPAVEELINHHPVVASEALNPRDAFFGGRTNANILYFKSEGVTKMHYFDICSLYPYINKTAKCPIGHPKVHIGDDCLKVPWQQMDGLMKVTVSPPRRLEFPVLPYRMHSRLMFFLCVTCAEKLYQCVCEHKEKERQFTGTWVMDEVKLAMKKGYEIVKIHEIWEYKVSQYDSTSRTGGFFAGFINHFLKIKAEASGWPRSCVTPEQKQAYIQEFYDREGILLDEKKIMFNPSLRAMAKLMLNSFWGRFGMRPDLLRTILIQTGEELRDMILDPKLDVHSILAINDDKMLVNYKIKDDARDSNKTTNVVIAAFTTAYARMELYKYLDMLGSERVHYFDTDSILFTQKEGEIMPEKGVFLGQMTDELEGYGPGSYITEFVSGGPKNYAFKAFSPSTGETHTTVKVKGITLNYQNAQLLNFDMIKNMVVDQNINEVELFNSNIRRTNTAEVYTNTRLKKTYRIKYTKRQKTGSNYATVPYGY